MTTTAATMTLAEVLSACTSVVTEAISWVSAMVTCITSNPLLLIFVVVAFVGLGVGLIRRIISL